MNLISVHIIHAISLVLLISISSTHGDTSPDVSILLKSICKDKRDVGLINKEQVELLAEEVTRNQPSSKECKKSVVDSIIALNKTLLIDESQLCSQHVTDSITKFYNDYVISSQTRAPATIRSIFSAYGLKLSQVCHERMVKLIQDIQNKSIFSDEDNQVIEQWMGKKSPLAYMLSDPKDYDNLVVPRGLLKDMSNVPHKRLALKYKTVDTIRALQLRCARRFQPIYEPLIMPLVALSTVGFHYKGQNGALNPSSDLSQLVFKWYRVFIVCETLGSFSIDLAKSSKSEEKDKLTHRMELMIIAPRSELTGAKIHQELMANEIPGLERLVYKLDESEDDIKANAKRLSDPIVVSNDSDLQKAMEKFKNKASKARNGCQLANKLVQKLQSRFNRMLYGKAGGTDVQLMVEYLEKGSYKVKQNCVRRVAIGVTGAVLASIFVFGAVLATKFGIDTVHHMGDAVNGIKDIADQIGELGKITSGATHAIDSIGSSISGLQDTIGTIGSHLPG